MSVRDTNGFSSPSQRTSKQPLRGFSGLMETFTSGTAAFTAFSSLFARVLNAPQLLQASMTSTLPEETGALSGSAAGWAIFLATLAAGAGFLAGGTSAGSAAFAERLPTVAEREDCRRPSAGGSSAFDFLGGI
uniref:Uncharacterized protein n=1 Tax=Tetraselmis chuii TaxID=63592 RepID=A0A7S1SMR3_9CHLO|eukprot:CAMPEP_0177762474 /NCGR_PEP_ID=MMETSP0491_2-20121128/6364_1 /TAXON_ID=63592 /ORGANISM="Tetraselmis chuii, Strain PLY429" /LENGTH=132 /DNA_ID=CAMNT_0019278531 /DNA_START=344 /DNA_END=742 /DNA_ORIENTATION=+